jgi:D-galactarolactone cycloisomerase
VRIEAVRVLGERLPMTLVEIVAEDGTVGIGGADAPAALLRPIIERAPWNLASIIRGQELDVTQLARFMTRATLGQGGLVAHAEAALDIALWDLKGKLESAPLYALLGKQIHTRIMPYASATAFDLTGGLVDPLPFKSTERLVSEASARVAEGFKAIKFGWGDHFEQEDLRRIAAIRQAIGPEIRFMLDFGGPDYMAPHIDVEYAAKILERLKPFDLYFFEEALLPYDAAGFLVLKCKQLGRIATGEMLCREWEFDQLIGPHAVDVIQPDAYRIGISAANAVMHRAAANGIMCVPHSPWSAFAVAAHVHILATLRNEVMVEYPSPSLFSDTVRHGELIRLANGDMVETPIVQQDGYILVPDRPGLGHGQFNYSAICRMEELSAKGLER